MAPTRVIDLSQAPGAPEPLRRSKWVTFSWSLIQLLLVSNRLQISSRLRAWTLRKYGAKIGVGVIMRPRLRVKSPWFLEIGDRSWIGDGVWFDNHDRITVGSDVSISQETYLTTGSHAVRTDMGLLTRPIVIEDGAWITTRCIILGGAHVGRSAVVSPMTVVRGSVPENAVLAPSEPQIIGQRFETGDE